MTKDHFISKFYIKKFLTNKVETCILYKKTGKVINKAPKSILKIDNLFPVEIEEEFSKYETRISKLFLKIEDNIEKVKKGEKVGLLDTDERYMLSMLFDFQIRRSQSVFSKSFVNNRGKELIAQLRKDYKFINGFSILELEKILDKNLYNYFVSFYTNKFFEKNNQIHKKISKRGIQILYINKGNFISGDFPMHSINANGSNGLNDKNTELFIPITPKILLVSSGDFDKFYYSKIDCPKTIRLINKLIYLSSHDIVFGKSRKLLEKIHKVSNNEKILKGYLKNINLSKVDLKLYSDIEQLLLEKGKIKKL